MVRGASRNVPPFMAGRAWGRFPLTQSISFAQERQTVAISFWFFFEDAELRVKKHLLRQGANEHAGVSLVIDSGGGCCQLLNNAILLDLPHCFEADFHILLSFKAYGLATSVHRGQGYKNGYIMGK